MAHKCQKLALLVGCNYPNTSNVLRGCINDVMSMREMLETRFGFDPKCVEIMIDDKPGSEMMPTGANIKEALNRMVRRAKPGDVLFFHFSGHGIKIPATKTPTMLEEEAIVPCDLNIITGMDLRLMVHSLPEGTTFTFCLDSCNSGGLISQKKEQISPDHPPRPQDQSNVVLSSSPGKPKFISYDSMMQQLTALTRVKILNGADLGMQMFSMFGADSSLMFHHSPHLFPKRLNSDKGIILSGCKPDEYCIELDGEIGGKPCGVFTYTLNQALTEHPGVISNEQIVLQTRHILEKKYGLKEPHPCLYCSDENVNAILLHQV